MRMANVICCWIYVFAAGDIVYDVSTYAHCRNNKIQWHRTECTLTMAPAEGDGLLCPCHIYLPRRTRQCCDNGKEYLGEHPQEIQTSEKADQHRDQSK